MFVPGSELRDFLLDARLVSRADLARLEEEAVEKSLTLYEMLRAGSLVPEDELVRAAAHILGVPFKELRHEEIEPQALLLVPEPLSRAHSVVVFRTQGGKAHALLLDTDDMEHLQFLEQEHHLRLVPHLTDRASIKRALIVHQKHLKEKYAERLKSASAEEAADALLSHALLARANEIYLESGASGDVRIRYRIKGVLREAMLLPAQAKLLLGKFKELANLSFTLPTPQEGRFKVTLKNGELLRVGVFTLYGTGGESMLLHLTPEASVRKGFTLESLGLHGESLSATHDILSARSGLVLVASPQGGGKTTTLYTLLDLASNPHTLAVSVEEKIEFVLPAVMQVEVRRDLGQTYASTLRAALKHNPDIVMVGEIKDEETAMLAATASSRGILVLAGVKTQSASKAIQKILSFDVPPLLLSAVLKGVVAQTVVRKLCQHCKGARVLSRAEIAPLEDAANFGRVLGSLKAEGAVDAGAQWKEVAFAEARGCAQCDDGYRGMLGVFEVLPVFAITRELILDEKKAKDPLYKEDVPLSIVEDAIFKAAAGQTSLDEVVSILEG